jgi:glycosyltransferase involved in cell wall biosynthesis
VDSVVQNALETVDVCFAYNDGSKVGASDYRRIYKALDPRIKYRYNPKNKGVAHSKNYLLKRMMDAGCDYMFIIEDDILIKSPKSC